MPRAFFFFANWIPAEDGEKKRKEEWNQLLNEESSPEWDIEEKRNVFKFSSIPYLDTQSKRLIDRTRPMNNDIDLAQSLQDLTIFMGFPSFVTWRKAQWLLGTMTISSLFLCPSQRKS